MGDFGDWVGAMGDWGGAQFILRQAQDELGGGAGGDLGELVLGVGGVGFWGGFTPTLTLPLRGRGFLGRPPSIRYSSRIRRYQSAACLAPSARGTWGRQARSLSMAWLEQIQYFWRISVTLSGDSGGGWLVSCP